MVKHKIFWQDYAFLVGTAIGVISLIPAIMDPQTVIPLITSIPTTIAIAIFTVAQASLKLRLAAMMSTLMTFAWLFLAVFRHP